MGRTTSANFTVRDGYIILTVNELTEGEVLQHVFDVDVYALRLAADLLNALNDQATNQEED
jgi:hypothetical protein